MAIHDLTYLPKSCYLIYSLSRNTFAALVVHSSGLPFVARDYCCFLGCLWRTALLTVERSDTKGFSLCGLLTLLTYEVENASVNFPLVRSNGVLSDFNSFAGHRFCNRCSIYKDSFWYQYIHASFE